MALDPLKLQEYRARLERKQNVPAGASAGLMRTNSQPSTDSPTRNIALIASPPPGRLISSKADCCLSKSTKPVNQIGRASVDGEGSRVVGVCGAGRAAAARIEAETSPPATGSERDAEA